MTIPRHAASAAPGRRTPASANRSPRWCIGLASLLLAAAICGACGERDAGPTGPQGGPRIQSVTPAQALPGQAVVLAGVNFGSDPARVTVFFDGRQGTVLSVSPTSIRAIVPSGVGPGRVSIQVTVQGSPPSEPASLDVVAPGPPFRQLALGNAFTCGIRAASGALCWGFGANGQLGQGASVNHSPVPVEVQGGQGLVFITAGAFHACALDGGGRAWCWGQNGGGQIGDGTMASRAAPVPVEGDLVFTALSAGSFHTCGLTASGAAYCWGRNASGQLGTGDRTDSSTPRRVAGDLPFASISAGGYHTCALTTAGAAACWGENGHGELGDGTRMDRPAPVPVSDGAAFVAISAGRSASTPSDFSGEHTCALEAGGRASCWGFNFAGQLGDGTLADSPVPIPVRTDRAFSEIAAGALHTCGVTVEGDALCWGANDARQLGTAIVNASVSAPALVLGGLRFATVGAGGAGKSSLRAVRAHSCGVTPDGTAFCWGENGSGQLGDGTVTEHSGPVPVTQPK